MVTTESLFREVFLPLYPADVAQDLARARREDANPAQNPHILAHLTDAAERFAQLAKQHLPEDPECDFTPASVHRLGEQLTRGWRDRLLEGDRETLAQFVIHGAAYLGEVIVRHAQGSWRVRRPLWESQIFLASRAGEAELAPFWWLLRSLDDAQIEQTLLGARFRNYVEAPTEDLASWPVLAPPSRRLPRIAKGVRYDVLHKHLRAHLPELRDLGVDFPTPERFAEYKFHSLDFALCEGGRVLLMYGPGEGGLHMFWLSTRGFERSMFVPCAHTPAPRVEIGHADSARGSVDTLTFHVLHDGKEVSEQRLVWGS